MAQLIKADGTVQEITPKSGKKFSLEELQKFVGGYIQVFNIGKGKIIIMDEEGKMKNRPVNQKATKILGLQGTCIVGDVVVCSSKQFS